MVVSNKSIVRKYWLSKLIDKNQILYIWEGDQNSHVLHNHDFTELVIVEKGRGVHFTSDSRHIIMAGDVFIVPKGVKHGYDSSEKLIITNIAFDLSQLDSLPQTFKQIPGFQTLFLLSSLQRKRTINQKGFLTLEPDQIAFVKQLTSRIVREQREKNTGYETVCTLVLADIIIFLSRIASCHYLDSHRDKLAIVLAYMEKHYFEHISLEQLSRIAKLSPRNFQQIFRDYIGASPFQQLIKIRLQHAGQMLRETDYSISEIAYASGFRDSAYFSRQFKKAFQTSPSMYRKYIAKI